MPHSQQPASALETLSNSDDFLGRHIGPNATQTANMLDTLGVKDLDTLIAQTVPEAIRTETTATLDQPCDEQTALAALKDIASQNIQMKSYIGMGYHPTYTPPVILRNVLENPGWYTAYTPYQPEIAQGRLEGLLTFQQMIIELTGMEMANASLLDEATAAAEAMSMAKRVSRKNKSNAFFVDKYTHPQTIAVLQTRASHFGFDLIVGDIHTQLNDQTVFGAYAQYPNTLGDVQDFTQAANTLHEQHALCIIGADILSLVKLTPPAQMGADIVVGSNQRFGIPMGFGGPHAAFFAFKDKHKRSTPGRIIGVSIDKRGNRALRMAMQTREQHIRREKANSNICTSQVLLALISAFYAMYHGNKGLTTIANRVHLLTKMLAQGVQAQGFHLVNSTFFDTITLDVGDQQDGLIKRAQENGINMRAIGHSQVGVSVNECSTREDIHTLLNIFSLGKHSQDLTSLEEKACDQVAIPENLHRNGPALSHAIFELHHSETQMLRYLKQLESKDIALNHGMIPLGSCTMKLNATAEMIPVTWPEFGNMHPFAPSEQTQGYLTLFDQLQDMLKACTGYDAISLQPNAGSQGEYAGLVAIKRYFDSIGQTQRDICLIPASAHGTNPASAQMVSMQVVVTACDEKGNVDIDDIKAKIAQYGDRIAALMVTYPSTHGVFEEGIREICDLIHCAGGQVYVDGANMNAVVGVAAPGEFGGDVSHLNLHKTFCIPHGGGGPGMGPIGVKSHLAPFVAGHPLVDIKGTDVKNGTISAAPWGSASILTISWMYIKMMGAKGVKRATEYAILNANYMAKRLEAHYPILYKGKNGFIAHECLLDLRPIKESSGITEEDIAKRLMDYGFHAPTMSFPVAGTLMIEPTESECKAELDRFCDAMIAIRQEVADVEAGVFSADDNPLVNAPHTLNDILDEKWTHSYSREQASRPLPYLVQHKVWPTVNRIDNVYGDRNLMCSCPSIESYS